jgi:hypothetical protein
VVQADRDAEEPEAITLRFDGPGSPRGCATTTSVTPTPPLIAEGAHPRAIMERLGHSSIQVTLGTYGHLF